MKEQHALNNILVEKQSRLVKLSIIVGFVVVILGAIIGSVLTILGPRILY